MKVLQGQLSGAIRRDNETFFKTILLLSYYIHISYHTTTIIVVVLLYSISNENSLILDLKNASIKCKILYIAVLFSFRQLLFVSNSQVLRVDRVVLVSNTSFLEHNRI